ncbi:hypothetical protein [Hugenholtzia roseola]|uniref:hypothetical protein n=1 Tax=Hugenholtzia roseola TaxID=1002 RepID=UPI00040DBD41|nr:hypothetical protein [Hugenholtzia roseola]
MNPISPEMLIIKILTSQRADEVLSRIHFKKQYTEMVKRLHPDVCDLPKAHEAVVKLNLFKAQLEKEVEDDAGVIVKVDAQSYLFKGEKEILEKSYQNYQALLALKDDASKHFRKYLPTQMSWQGGGLLVQTGEESALCYDLKLEEKHVAWAASRMLEFVSWLHQVGYVHGGLVPQSWAIIPKTHGMVCLSFYHLTPLNGNLETLSGAYSDWYPSSVFAEKKATPNLDLSIIQKVAISLLGDPSGAGVKLKATHDENLINFWIQSHQEAFTTYEKYRKLLQDLYGKPKFYPLTL